MKKIVFVQLVLLILILCSSCKDNHTASGTYNVINIPAPSLRTNLVGADTIQQIGVYLPPSYYTSDKSYPVVYFLLGHATKVRENNPKIFDIMEHKTVQEMIFVEISGYNLYKGSMYANSPITGNWEDFVTKDVIAYMDKNFRTIPDKASRGLAGHSMGGLGSFNISLKHPDTFSCIHLMSPAISEGDDIIDWVFSNDSTIISLKHLSNKLENNLDGNYAERIIKSMIGVGDLWLIVGLGVSFAPDAEQPLFMDLPFNYNEGGTFEKNEPVWELWRNGTGNLSEKVKKYKKNLKLYTYYGMDVGYHDQLGFNVEAVKKLSFYMTEDQVSHSVHFYDGDHYNKFSENLEFLIVPQMSIYLQGE